MLASSPSKDSATDMLHRCIRLFTQAFAITIVIVVAAVVSRGIYLQVAQAPAGELEDVSDIDRPTPSCPAPYWEQSAPRDRPTEQRRPTPTGCLET